MVEVDYETLKPILTIEDAIKHQSYHGTMQQITRGATPSEVFKSCDHFIEGEVNVGGQEQFYLECQGSHVVPGEGDEVTVYSSTQNPTETQKQVAHVLGIPENRVVVKVKRLGGGFGGKETRGGFISCAAAVAAKRTGKPVRLVLDRDDDMLMTGGRNPFIGKYKVGFSKEGIIQALDIELYANGGHSHDLSMAVLHRALFHVDNCYYIPNVHAKGFLCKTNLPTNTAFRGFGGPQSMQICESWVDRIADVLNIHPSEVRRRNFYKVNQETHYKQRLMPNDTTYLRAFEELMTTADISRREEEIRAFNEANKLRKRGLYCLPTKFGVSYTVRMLNQAGALVNVYTDGSVLVTHGGTEMGQGLHTKMAQVAAQALGCAFENVFISETATDKVPNTSPSAASVQSDINGAAVINACEKIVARLAPFKADNPDASFAEICNMAYLDQVSLSATGFFCRPEIGYDFTTNTGTPFAYYSNGAVATEVEIDPLTGDFQILRSDIIMDVGRSLSPSIDIGQIEGAFMQGMGWSTIEEVVWAEDGSLLTRGPGAYKIPSFSDVPIDFRVNLLKDSECPRVIHSSKGVGEPPFFLGCSVLFALREAIKSARKDNGVDPSKYFPLSLPATCERIRMSCKDEHTRRYENDIVSY